MFRVKICGLRTVDDAKAAAAAGADAVGLNFYPKSARYLDQPHAAEVAESIPAGVLKVGLFVNSSAEQILAMQRRLGLDVLQLHGDETPQLVAELRGHHVLKAFRLAPGEAAKVLDFVAACANAKAPLAGVLIDAYDASAYGGTGMKADWPAAAELRKQLAPLPLILAGGLTPDNVAAAIHAVQPYGVDTASGVEVARGQKDPGLMASFVRNACAALGMKR